MQLLCDMPSGPHNAEKEKLASSNLATAVDYRHAEDARRLHYMKEAVIFMIKHVLILAIWSLTTLAAKSACDCAQLATILPRLAFLKMHYMLVIVHRTWKVPKN